MSFFNKNNIDAQYDDCRDNQAETLPSLDSECKIVDEAVQMEGMVEH